MCDFCKPFRNIFDPIPHIHDDNFGYFIWIHERFDTNIEISTIPYQARKFCALMISDFAAAFHQLVFDSAKKTSVKNIDSWLFG